MKIQKRIVIFSIFLCIGVSVIIGRLAQIQLIESTHFGSANVNLIKESMNQRRNGIPLSDGRGSIVDRNGVPLVNGAKKALVLLPYLKDVKWPIEEVAKILNVRSQLLEQQVKELKQATVYGKPKTYELNDNQVAQLQALRFPGIIPVTIKENKDEQFAQHVIGMVKLKKDDKKGYAYLSGVQKAFNPFLKSNGEEQLVYDIDNRGKPLHTQVVVKNKSDFPLTVVTTIDTKLQQLSERLMDKVKIKKGALVLVDIEKNELLSMVSRPLTSIENPYEEKDGSRNQATTGQFPGSIFKTIIATAALEMGQVTDTETFDCNQTVHGEIQPIVAKQKGLLNLEDSFAASCNRTFAVLGQRVVQKDSNAFETYATKLGALGQIGWQGDVYEFTGFSQFPDEERGTIWLNEQDKKILRAVEKTSIGQQNVKLTPMAVANMIATIARGGEKYEVKVVKQLLHQDGSLYYEFPSLKLPGEPITPETAKRMQALLRSVVTSEKGTGHLLDGLPYDVAGKSGTAQKDITKDINNKWFAGYFPYEKPKYALVVVDFEGTGNYSAAHDLYGQFVRELDKEIH
ncbi:MAG: peptidoglycan D,D-transpeptidase FtsI family protein [Bacillaceae bacterium]